MGKETARKTKKRKNTQVHTSPEEQMDLLTTAELPSTPSEHSNNIQQQIDHAFALDLDRPNRMSHDGEEEIESHDRKQATEIERHKILLIAALWGCGDRSTKTWSEHQKVALAVCKMASHDHGHRKASACSQVQRWLNKVLESNTSGDAHPLLIKHHGSEACIKKVEELHPGYLHELYRHGTKIKGDRSTFEELACLMNEKSRSPDEARSDLDLHPLQATRWFHENGGKEKQTKEKPYLSEEQKHG